ncbi:Rmd6p NDAI_0D00760 [Naumovozyma dairenensis CBS 421]|uniref:Uncharacterized protein n=1 Tax=Naumovozyma dairenensis (strain ATCC 10597 / BCRC 20456 / CBS 421 / NBRC 0211 / NRRL Y-12639) TaxID=1071378 RepID=G0W9C9_NAUDC|nr:hypothetical protein NDAI_0D00760 [Naumovozyma dairenensis CBS 421]CCD24390.1 hypothetical protein NDAI_0D00760 [Naumovozyma dairenensis CBS 421]
MMSTFNRKRFDKYLLSLTFKVYSILFYNFFISKTIKHALLEISCFIDLMTQSKSKIIVLPTPSLKTCPVSTIQQLVDIINKGYEKPMIKYNLVQTQRIRGPAVFFQELALADDRSLLYLTVKDTEEVSGALQEDTTIGDYEFFTIKSNESYNFTPDNVQATIAYRPNPQDDAPNTFEVTAFTSFIRNGGLDIFNATLPHFKKIDQKCDRLLVKVIADHELVPYYENKLDFIETHRVLVPKSQLEKSGFHDTFRVSRDFHVASMIRDI